MGKQLLCTVGLPLARVGNELRVAVSQGETQILSSSASEKECFTSWRSKQKRPAKLVNERHGTVLWPVMRPVVVVVWRKAEENGREPHPTQRLHETEDPTSTTAAPARVAFACQERWDHLKGQRQPARYCRRS